MMTATDSDQKPPPELPDQVRDAIRLKHCSISTETGYADRIGRCILFHNKRHPKDTDGGEIEAFLTHPATKHNVSASTQNKAFSALLFLYRHILRKEPGNLKDTVRAKRKPYIPVVLSRQEIDSDTYRFLFDLCLIIIFATNEHKW